MNITEALTWEGEEIVAEVFDPCKDETIPRGKQYWLQEPDSIWYTRTTGIWQTVWMEPVNSDRIQCLKYTPDIDNGTVRIDYSHTGNKSDCTLELDISMDEEEVAGYPSAILKWQGISQLTFSIIRFSEQVHIMEDGVGARIIRNFLK